jgi:transcriptional regulator with XRE-family HTH domain
VADIGIVAIRTSFLPLVTARSDSVWGTCDSLKEEKAGEQSRTRLFARNCIKSARGTFLRVITGGATGQTPEAIAEFEDGKTSPSVAFLLRLSQTLKIDPDTFLSTAEKTTIREKRVREFVTRTQNYSYRTLTPDGEREHLRSFMITIDPWQAHKALGPQLREGIQLRHGRDAGIDAGR